MILLSFLIQLFGATMLLLFAVRMVRTGMERAFGSGLNRMVTRDRHPLLVAPVGVALAILLQSSAAVALLVAGFAGGGAIGFAPAIAIVLGADLGSALLVQVLSLELDWLAPALLALGGALFLKTERRALRHAGRILLGIALILLSLSLLREAVSPIRDSAFLPAVSTYLERDPVTAFLVGALLAFAMHSSVATILMCVTFVAISALSVPVGIALVLGANLGSALIPVWLSRGYGADVRRIPLANLVIRGSIAVLAMLAFAEARHVYGDEIAALGADGLILLHIAFNASLLLLVPVAGYLERPLTAVLPLDKGAVRRAQNPDFRSVLPDEAPRSGPEALANLRREVLRMAGIVGEMFAPVMDLYARANPELTAQVSSRDDAVNAALDGVRWYSSRIPEGLLDRDGRKELRALIDYAIALEAAGDIVVKRLLILAEEMHKGGVAFSAEGRAELEHLHRKAARNLKTAVNVLVSAELGGARRLIEEKADMARLERKSRKRHLKRLSAGDGKSLVSSDKHVETAYLIKEFNSWVVTVAHPILVREGQLRETRLVEP